MGEKTSGVGVPEVYKTNQLQIIIKKFLNLLDYPTTLTEKK